MAMRLLLELKGPDEKPITLSEPEEGVPEIFVDGIHGIMGVGQAIKLNFFTRDYPGKDDPTERRRVVCRLTMTLELYLRMVDMLRKNAEEIQKDVTAQQQKNRL